MWAGGGEHLAQWPAEGLHRHGVGVGSFTFMGSAALAGRGLGDLTIEVGNAGLSRPLSSGCGAAASWPGR